MLLPLIFATLISCNIEPVELIKITIEDPITKNSELYKTIEHGADENTDDKFACIDFIYALNLNIFDKNLEYVGKQIINNDSEFSFFLENLQEGFSIDISYPIFGTTNDGKVIEVNNNEELKTVIINCLDDETILYCNNILADTSCVWKIAENDGGNNNYKNAYFDISNSGATSFYFKDNVYYGNWITYLIGYELHFNITFEDGTDVSKDWNFDWIMTNINENNLVIENENHSFSLAKDCDIITECSTLEFEECEINSGVGVSEFNLDNYNDCIINFIGYETTENATITFYKTLTDAENNTNTLTNSLFTNNENPQSLNVRIEYPETIIYTVIKLTATNCD